MREFFSKCTDGIRGRIVKASSTKSSEVKPSSFAASSPLQRFAKNEKGVVAIFFVIMAMPLLYATGLAVNYTDGSQIKVSLQDAADAAALASVSPGVYNKALSPTAQQTASAAAATQTFSAMVPSGVTVTGSSVTTKVNMVCPLKSGPP